MASPVVVYDRSGLGPSRLATFMALLAFWASFPSRPSNAQDSANLTHNKQSGQIATLKAVARRVEVDVVVTDSQSRPVAGLTQEDFQVEEEKVQQPLRSFDVHTAESVQAGPKIPDLPPNTFLNMPTSQDSGPATVLLYDMLNGSSLDSQQQFLAFVKEHRWPGRIAIFGLSDRLYLIQSFTEQLGPEDLYKGLKRVADEGERNPVESPLDRMGPLRRRALVTLDALSGVGRFLAPISGRKTLIWYSTGIPENYLPGSRMASISYFNPKAPSKPGPLPPMYQDEFKKAVDLLTVGHVTVYPVDVRGVSADFLYSAEIGGMSIPPWVLENFRETSSDVNVALHSTMDTFADATGGHAFYGTNDLEGAVEQAIADGSTYYSLTYEPTNPKYDGSLRHIKVTLKKPGYNLSYRKTYYADDLNAVARAAADAPESPLSPALERGTPLAHGLFVEAHLDTAGPPVAATPEQRKALAQFQAMPDQDGHAPKKTSGAPPPVMMQQYTISYALFAKQLELSANEAGTRTASLEFGVVAYDEDGRKLTGLDTRVDDPLPAERYAKIAADGYRVAQTVAVPVTATCLRLAVRDTRSNRIGSLEVRLPLAKAAEAQASEGKAEAK